MDIEKDVGAQKVYYRDLLEVAIGAVLSTNCLDLDGGRLHPAPEFWDSRSRTLEADIFLAKDVSIRSIHGKGARVLLVSLHADEALLSWSGEHHTLPIRAELPSVLGGGQRVSIYKCSPHAKGA